MATELDQKYVGKQYKIKSYNELTQAGAPFGMLRFANQIVTVKTVHSVQNTEGDNSDTTVAFTFDKTDAYYWLIDYVIPLNAIDTDNDIYDNPFL